MTRRESRETALCLIFEYSFNPDKTPEEVLELSSETERECSAFAKRLFFTAVENISAIDELISNAADNWKITRIGKVSLAILRIAVCEMKYTEETPREIVINEALELTRKYDDDKAVAFVNGVLGKIIN